MREDALNGKRDEFLSHIWKGWRIFVETERTCFLECKSLLQTMDSEEVSLMEEYHTNVSNALDDMRRSFDKEWSVYEINNKVSPPRVTQHV